MLRQRETDKAESNKYFMQIQNKYIYIFCVNILYLSIKYIYNVYTSVQMKYKVYSL